MTHLPCECCLIIVDQQAVLLLRACWCVCVASRLLDQELPHSVCQIHLHITRATLMDVRVRCCYACVFEGIQLAGN